MNKEQRTLLNFLKKGHKGRQKAVPSTEIRKQLGFQWGRTEEKTRELIREMIIDFKSPIGSSTKGYFVIVDVEDLDVAVSHLENRIKKTTDRINSLEKLRSELP